MRQLHSEAQSLPRVQDIIKSTDEINVLADEGKMRRQCRLRLQVSLSSVVDCLAADDDMRFPGSVADFKSANKLGQRKRRLHFPTLSAIAESIWARFLMRHFEASPKRDAARCSFRTAAGLRRARRKAAIRWRLSSRL